MYIICSSILPLEIHALTPTSTWPSRIRGQTSGIGLHIPTRAMVRAASVIVCRRPITIPCLAHL